MKKFFLTLLTILVVGVLFLAAICIGSVKDFKSEREQLLLSCAEMHASSGKNLVITIDRCEERAEQFDDRLEDSMLGVVALVCGVEPVWTEVNTYHEQLLANWEDEASFSLGEELSALLDEHVDTSLSFTKVVLTVILLIVIFGAKGRKRGFTLGKLLAGFGLFKLWKKK